MSIPYSHVIHIHDDMTRLYFDEEAQAFLKKPDGVQAQLQVQEQSRRKKRCWEPPVFFALPSFFLQPTKKAKSC